MKNVYIDVSHSFCVSSQSGQFNGGNNYSKRIIELLLKNAKIYMIKPFILCMRRGSPFLKELFGAFEVEYIELDRISSLKVNEGDVYYNPLMDDSISFAKDICKFRMLNHGVKIYLTIHDRRHVENWYDKYDGLLKNGIKRNAIILAIGRAVHALEIEAALKKSVSIADKIFTVSNYSMQSLLSYKKIKYINWFYQGVYGYESGAEVEVNKAEDYLLFVSAGRPEKNLIRTLIAFEKYVNKSCNKKIKLKCVGISVEMKERLREKLRIDANIWSDQIEFLGYVPLEVLNDLYRKCRFLVFTSKNEGFGLPVLEATLYNKPVLASNISSIPEVIGATAVYVNPFDVNSICDGINKLMDDNFYNYNLEIIKKKRRQIIERIDLDTELLIHEILE